MPMTKHTTLEHLKKLAERTKSEIGNVDNKVSDLSGKIDGLVTTGGEPNKIESIKMNGVAQEIAPDKSVDLKTPGYTVEKAAESGDFAAVYQFKKDGQPVGAAINIPKDMVVESGSVVTNPEGKPEGTYIKLVLQNVVEPLYIDVGTLIEYVTSGSVDGDMVVITVDPLTHKVSAKIADGSITKIQLASDLVVELDGKAAGDHIHNNATSKADGFMSKEDKAKLDDYGEATDLEVETMLTEVFGPTKPVV